MPNFAVIGLGSFGFFVSKYLAERGFQVIAIDKTEARVNEVKPFVEKAVIADATNKENLINLGLQDMDAVVVSVGDAIDASILVVLYLKELGVKRIIAKAMTLDHGKILDIIGATDIIFPEKDMAFRLAQSLDAPNVLDYLYLAPGYSIIELAPPTSFLGKTLKQLDLRNKYGVQIIIIKEVVPENIIVVPKADHVIKDSDILVAMGKDEDLERIKKLK
ncbi:MAG: TrkA family potassium uptake protein [candidate division KSB1 bacterium]|nr:TrkA family potassium uptake protein [candidate division KSB1 bacterium]